MCSSVHAVELKRGADLFPVFITGSLHKLTIMTRKGILRDTPVVFRRYSRVFVYSLVCEIQVEVGDTFQDSFCNEGVRVRADLKSTHFRYAADRKLNFKYHYVRF